MRVNIADKNKLKNLLREKEMYIANLKTHTGRFGFKEIRKYWEKKLNSIDSEIETIQNGGGVAL